MFKVEIAMQKRKIIILIVGVLAFITGLVVALHRPSIANAFHGTLLQQPREIGTFELTGIDQKPFNNASLKGQWTLLFFGFTHCRGVCPTTMAELNKMYRALSLKSMPKVVMITLDPEADSLSRLGEYVKAFNPHFYGARGTKEAIHKMTSELGIAYAKIKTSEFNYDIEHSGSIILFNPQGKLAAFFTTPHQASLLVKDLTLLQE
jgi:protein SCO1/2